MNLKIPFAINRICAPRLPLEDFLKMVVRLGVDAVEFRNDLEGVEMQDGTPGTKVREMVKDYGLKVLSINALYPFDVWDDMRKTQAETLARYARDCGAPALVMCPLNSRDDKRSEGERRSDLIKALRAMRPILRDHGLIGHVEPLGFPQCALRLKRAALEAIAEIGGEDTFNLMHDTFHHHLASDPDYFPERTGLVQISGVEDASIPVAKMLDGHRVLVGERDVLGNAEQIRALLDGGYRGYFSFEPFSEAIQRLSEKDAEAALRASMDYLNKKVSELG
ncbi:MAG TPA: TIM barrel protein [Candidatus Competibacteraceae bacterium]|nr:TIM barrel protein [Candidatus Competibacteraceae bacterium]